MIRIAMIGLGGVVLALMFRQQKSEYALYISIGAALLILILSVEKLGSVVETVQNIRAHIQLDSAMIKILLKMIGITYVAEFASQICRDAGFGALGSQI
ncbi:MAG: stage III sporulation protein AD, partial [Clostridiales bacterium]|nr:stage III sporulation protein AD [Clostridiales bacterium]